MPAREDYIAALNERLAELQAEIELKRDDVREILEAINELQEHALHIVNLLEAEGISSDELGLDGTLTMSVSDMAYKVLSELAKPQPIYYRDLAELITEEGMLIPGQDPGANLISHIARDERFIRTSRGTYALAEWDFEPMKKSKTRRRKRRA